MTRLGFDHVPFVLPPRIAMDGAISRAPITFDGALAAPVALDAEITFDEPEESTISMGRAFAHWNRLR